MTSLLEDSAQLQLRDYQQAAVDQVRARMRAGKRRVILAMPTGSGKTETAIHLIHEAVRKGSTVWFIVDRVTLVDQTSARFGGYGIDHGVMQADHFLTDMSKQVQVVSAQTLVRRLSTLHPALHPHLVIIDEAHVQFADIMAYCAKSTNIKVVGLTATPFTDGMARTWDDLVNAITVNQLLAEGHLAPLRIKACVRPDMVGAKRKFTGEFEEEDAGERGITIIGNVVDTWVEQTLAMFGGPAKTIVFSPSVKHGAELCRKFATAGYNFQQLSHLDRDEDERRAKIAEFRKPDSAIHGLVSCAVLTRGFDVPDVLVGISCRPYRKSFSSHVQEMGRVMRTSPGKSFGLWLDHSGNCISFADDTAWLYEYGADTLSDAEKRDSTPREPTEAAQRKHFCRECGMQMPPGSDTCPGCGWQRQRLSEIRTVSGTLIDLDLSTKRTFEPRPGLRAECLSNPRRIWNAALSYCVAHGRGGEDKARKWAYGVWAGIYPGCRLPKGFFEGDYDPGAVATNEWELIDREVRRFRTKKRAA